MNGLGFDNFARAFEKHIARLNDDLQLWCSIANEQESASTRQQYAQQCLQNTKIMIDQCANIPSEVPALTMNGLASPSPERDLKASERGPTRKEARTKTEEDDVFNVGRSKLNLRRVSDEPEDQPAMKKARRGDENPNMTTGKPIASKSTSAPPTYDPTKLFTIYTNPTPVNELLSTFAEKTKPKRKQSDQSTIADGVESLLMKDSQEGRPKRNKTKKASKEQEVAHTVAEIEAQHTAFEEKVALRLKEQEEARQKKLNKKRKRVSDASAPDPEGNSGLAEHLEPKKSAKKQRKAEINRQLDKARAENSNVTKASVVNQNTTRGKKAAKAATVEDAAEEKGQVTLDSGAADQPKEHKILTAVEAKCKQG